MKRRSASRGPALLALIAAITAGTAGCSCDASLQAPDSSIACESAPTSTSFVGRTNGVQVFDCSSTASAGGIVSESAATGNFREEILFYTPCDDDGGCGLDVAPPPLCNTLMALRFVNVPLVTGLTGDLSNDAEPIGVTWGSSFVAFHATVDRPDLGAPCAAGGRTSRITSGTYSVVQGGTYGDDVVVEVRDVVLETPLGPGGVIDLVRWRAHLVGGP